MKPLAECLVGKADLQQFEMLRKQYDSGRLALFAGLGISCGSGLPNWETLTKRLLESMPRGSAVYEGLRATGYSLPAMLSWAGVRLDAKFREKLRGTLYEKLDPWFRQGMEGLELRDKVRLTNPTLAAVAAFLGLREGDAVVPNPKVRAVVTTNADTLLRYYSRTAFHSDYLRTVERASAGPIPGRINVYHLHGMIRFDSKRYPSKEATDHLIFTDLDYYVAYRELGSIFTYTPLYLFREYSFLFIGTRLTDDNIRRLLYWCQREIVSAYRAEKARPPLDKRIRHFALVPRGESPEAMKVLLRPLGVAPIWYRSHSDLPSILSALYADEASWSYMYGGA